jgi:uncharacterized RDD family membrane protein YckC
MTDHAAARPYLPDPVTAPELFDGLLTRRVTAYLIDVVLISMLVLAITIVGAILGFFTFGLAWISLVFAVPLAVIAYYSVTLGSHRRATVGMQMMDIVLTPTRGQPLDGYAARAGLLDHHLDLLAGDLAVCALHAAPANDP